ncbi:hypothetical protein ACH5RR_015592 [Cinchona calisaya]|uniref:Endonuclease/exonuclease/phosphatase n=1 Tax=Cinchona calisaya TaxID=153742 RepID=A0ABD2ZUU2_9GENT
MFSVEHLNRSSSDHLPLLVSIGARKSSSPRPFHFQHMWIEHPSFIDMVRQDWSTPPQGYGMESFAWNLKCLKAALRKWNEEVFGDVFMAVRYAKDRVRDLEIAYETLQSISNWEALHLALAELFSKLRT